MNWNKKWMQSIRKGAVLCTILILLTGCGNTADSQDNGSEDTVVQTAESESPKEDTVQEDSKKFPAFTATDLEGNTVTESIFADKDLTVLNIWGTFCNPCVGEMPELGEWAKEMPDNVQMIGLIIDIAGEDDKEHHDMAVTITERAGAAFTQVIANNDFADILQEVVGVPTTLFVDKEGNLVGEPVVGAYVDGYKQFVEEYLSGK